MKNFIPESILREKKKYSYLFLLALVIVIFSFPEIDLGYDIGIDPPLKWLYNYLFANGLNAGKNIIFPHGPLAFFMYPLASNFLLATLVTIVLQMVFVFQLFQLLDANKKLDWLITAVLAWFVFSLSNFNQLVISNVSIAYLLFLKDGKPANKYWGLALTVLAFYVKAWVAIITGTLSFSLLVIQFFRYKNYRQLVIDIAVLLGLMYFVWIIMYGSLTGFIDYCVGMFHLAGDNSAAAAYHPKNNWLLVAPLLLTIFILPFIRRTEESKTYGLLFFLSFFAAWKYGMAREDYSHVRTYLFFLLASMILFVVYKRKDILLNSLVIVVAIVLFVFNMKNVENPQPISFHHSGIANFVKFIGSYSEIKNAAVEQNQKNTESNRLTAEARKIIGGSSVDIYPWDYTIVAANDLNWKARPVIQSYAAYTSWLDKKNAEHFSSSEAPEYFIFDLNKITFDLNGEKMESIDNRYLLNDEPQTILQIIKNYEPVYTCSDFLVYRKLEKPLEIHSVETKPEKGRWLEWITVPDSASAFTRLKLQLNTSFSGKMKSMFYKDELYYMYLKTSEGRTFNYRIVPKNAADGIWIAPFYTSVGDNSPVEKVEEVMVMCSDKNMVRSPFILQWEYFDRNEKEMNKFFGKDSVYLTSVYISDGFNFDSDNASWKGFNKDKILNFSYYKQKAYRLDPEIFSPSFAFSTDSIPALPARVCVDCWLKPFSGAKANLVIETENAAGKKNWHGIEINRQIINPEGVNHIYNFMDLNEPATNVSVYIWNNGKKSLMVYGLDVKVVGR